MNYGEAVKQSMEMLAQDPLTIFIAYNMLHGSRVYGSLKDISQEQCVEMPVAENLMAGLAIGMSLEGDKPVLIFERHDFMLNALDALINHLDKLEELSYGEFIPKVIIRAIVGPKGPINPGPQHMQDFSGFFKETFNFPVYDPRTAQEVMDSYQKAKYSEKSSMIIDRRSLYDRE